MAVQSGGGRRGILGAYLLLRTLEWIAFRALGLAIFRGGAGSGPCPRDHAVVTNPKIFIFCLNENGFLSTKLNAVADSFKIQVQMVQHVFVLERTADAPHPKRPPSVDSPCPSVRRPPFNI